MREVALLLLAPILVLTFLYGVRHYIFTLNRLLGWQRSEYIDIDRADWPSVTILVAAHNEETVIADALNGLLFANYPMDKLVIMPVNDRSTDGTKRIIDEFAEKYPGRIVPFHRTGGKPGKAAALKDVTERVRSDIIIVFDADYLPGQGLIKQLAAPFFDPEVGATMGRVVPQNVDRNLLTRLLDLERSGGYQVDQQARMNLGLVPQYGGTVGGVRLSALLSVGGWSDDVLAEDTDLTYRLLLNNWKTVYQNRAECYEEVPETWPVRIRQIKRWAQGHNQALYRHFWKLFFAHKVTPWEKFDGLALLGVYAMSPLIMLGWLLTLYLYYQGAFYWAYGLLVFFLLISFSSMGNSAAFFEIAAATYLDGTSDRVRLLPMTSFGFLVSIVAISSAMVKQIASACFGQRELWWDKTERYRKSKN